MRFGVTASLLVAGTLVLVLYVLPERYVLSSGFRESGMSFPAPRTPFVPVPVVHVAARPLPQPAAEPPRGPAEIFWEELTPLLREERYLQAVDRFQSYLQEHPGDRGARREYAITLVAAGRADDAVPELRRLLDEREDFAERLLLARTLRELDRMSEADDEYAALVGSRPDDVDLRLEWARGHAWIEEYDEAAAVLRDGLARRPDSAPLRIELARVEFSRDRLQAASDLLADVDEAALAAEDAVGLRDAVLGALAAPEVVLATRPPPTLLERALRAREADDFELARGLFEEALRENADDGPAWQAYADLLEYELSDFEGARDALLEVERLSPEALAVQHRLAQLEIWTGRTDEARERLLALLPLVEAEPAPAEPVTVAEIHATLGDLERWDGDRIAAAGRYGLALESDPANGRALDGLTVLEAELALTLIELEQPRVGATSYAMADTDDFSRLDVGGEWVEVEDRWAWGGSAGNRWLDGRGPGGLPAEVRQGVFVDLEAAKWWRWGTLRSGARVGMQRVLDDWDYSVGGSLTHRDDDGSRTDLRYEHGPAYPVTATLQSAVAGVVQDQLSLSHARRLGARWTLTGTVEGAWLRTDLDSLPSARNESTTRLQGAVSVGREVAESLTLGVSARAMGYTGSAPIIADAATATEQRLFWDPKLALSSGPFVRLDHELSSAWAVTGSLGPGLALIDERTGPGWDVVPHVSAEAGLQLEAERLRTSLDVFFYQGQFDGYRMYGARLSLSARDLPRLGGSP